MRQAGRASSRCCAPAPRCRLGPCASTATSFREFAAITPTLEARRLLLPESAWWRDDFVAELTSFPPAPTMTGWTRSRTPPLDQREPGLARPIRSLPAIVLGLRSSTGRGRLGSCRQACGGAGTVRAPLRAAATDISGDQRWPLALWAALVAGPISALEQMIGTPYA